MRNTPVLIEAAINGVVPKSWNPHVPHTLDDVRADIRACFAAGASIVHNHAPAGATGPNGLDFYVQAWEPILAERPGAIVYPTLGSQGSLEERIGHFEPLAKRGLLRVGAIESIWPNNAFEEGIGVNALVSDEPGPPKGGGTFHDTAVWLRPA